MSLRTPYKPLSVIIVSHSQCFKSRGSIEAKSIFPKDIEEWGSDFTIHSLMRKYDNGKKMKNKVGSINDMTILFMSKQPRTTERLLGALSESMTEGTYKYSERAMDIEWTPERYAILSNITFERYEELDEVFGKSTFNERFFRCYYTVKEQDWDRFNFERNDRVIMKLNPKVRIRKQPKLIPLTDEDTHKMLSLGKQLQMYGMYSSQGTTRDIVESLLFSNALFNNRNKVLSCDFDLVKTIINKLVVNPFDMKTKVLQSLRKSHSVKQVSEEFKIPEKTIYNWRKGFRLRGVL